MKSSTSERQGYFCHEPWTGGFAIQTNQDVKFCPCYLNLKIGSLRENTIAEIWNSGEMQQIRRSFSRGELPPVCRGQLCDVALGNGPPPPVALTRRRPRRWRSRVSLRGLAQRLAGLFRT